ncbi:hypothetical protein BGM26_15260 [Bacillus sp. FJAT-29790]|uniref:anti-sigma factor family protein n=1 Tax=Bacillus sp. FJAT-29790 TaxID=1895002 RepID=UPI001C250B18|nr:hypothetical protein [Bacillus sp. FJAT-29790]MBU8880309.1 hypothetical protein [Bacillus sp. FJAT-29790]
MKHYSEQEWLAYVKNELDEDARVLYENHLYSCDQCLEIYFQAVAEEETELPVISNEADFTDLVMAQISESKVSKIRSSKSIGEMRKPFCQSAVFHYSIAAAMTILLMMTGVFQSITKYAENVQSPEFQEKETPLSLGIVDKTFAWMDSLEKMKEAEK